MIDEAEAGDPAAAKSRLAALRDVVLLELVPEAGELARDLLRLGGMPDKAYVDASHVALSAVHGIDYLLTWNWTHIANATVRRRIEAICRGAGFEPAIICTPVEFVLES